MDDNIDIKSNNTEYDNACEIVNLIYELLSSAKLNENFQVNEYIIENSKFSRLYELISSLRELADALNKGDLQKMVEGKGYVLSNLKALQANLRHLTWQTKKIAEGDFTQKVDFLGDFSESFNIMTKKLDESSRQLHELAHVDPLTNIPNRLNLSNFLDKSFNAAKEMNTDLSIMMFDIDFFKDINDSYGHDAGDEVIVAVSKKLAEQFRSMDMLARYGGDEFMAVLPGANLEDAQHVARRAILSVSSEIFVIGPDIKLSLTISSGISEIREDDKEYDDIIKRSDMALYKAKQNGRNQVVTVE